MFSPIKLTDIHQVVAFLQQELAQHPQVMSAEQQERAAAAIVGLGANDKFDAWREQYPKLGKIFDLASDLEWSNVASTDDTRLYWQTVAALVDELSNETSV